MFLEILTPEKRVFKGEVEAVKLPGSEELGKFQVLKNHAPIISSLTSGTIEVKQDKEVVSFEILSGFVEVLKNKIAVLVEGLVEEENEEEQPA